MDGDGRFTPAVDAVDLDRDGEATPRERAHVLRASFHGAGLSDLPPTEQPFTPATDWIYLDDNNNGERDTRGDDVTDETPAFGEPIFVPDDVNGNGQLDPAERLIRLGSSKFRAVYIDDYRGHINIYRRGTNLSQTPVNITNGLFGYADTLHASGVIGILSGGLALPSRRFVGIAPDAELYNASGMDEHIPWALMQNPDVVIHEYVTWTHVELDGSDIVSTLIDESSGRGAVNVCPAGNIGDAQKHGRADLQQGDSTELEFTITEPLLLGSLYAVGDGELHVEIIGSDETVQSVGPGFASTFVDGIQVSWQSFLSERGTQMVFFDAEDAARTTWRLRVTSVGGSLAVHGMLADNAGFSRSTAWTEATPDSTLAWPATADSCIAVGSVPSHLQSEDPRLYPSPEARDEVRAYSARGPRIDGDLRPHVVAPDNPWSALGSGEIFPQSPRAVVADRAAYQIFGGTSGAGPHVAGLAALLVQTGLGVTEIRARINESALLIGDAPNNNTGHGRIQLSVALGGAVAGQPPAIAIRFEPPIIVIGESSVLIVDALADTQVRWDDGYDGAWDTEFQASENRTFAPDSLGDYRVKVRARDDEGRYSEAVALLRVVEALPVLPDAGPADAGPADSGPMDARVDLDADPTEVQIVSWGDCSVHHQSDVPTFALLLVAVVLVGRRRSQLGGS